MPVGVPAPGATAATVAVNVTFCPGVDGLADEVTAVVVLALFTTWSVASAPLLLLKLALPLYVAVTVYGLPVTVSVEVLACAVPPLKLTGAPRLDPSMRNWTVPVGVPDPGDTAATVAVKVTFCPKTDGLADEVTPVVVFALFTVWPPASVPSLLLKLPLPLYCAMTLCGLPLTVRVAVLVCALPPLKLTGAPKLEPSTTNCTVPAGVPAPGATAATVAVKVTFCPNTDGVPDDVTPVVVFALFTVWPPASVPLLLLKLLLPLYSAVTACGLPVTGMVAVLT